MPRASDAGWSTCFHDARQPFIHAFGRSASVMTDPDSALIRHVHNSVASSPAEPRPMGVKVKVPALDGYELGGTSLRNGGRFQPDLGGGVRRWRRHPSVRISPFRGISCGLGNPGAHLRLPWNRSFAATKVARIFSFQLRIGRIRLWRSNQLDACTAPVRRKLVGIAHSVGTLIIGGAPTIGELGRLVFIRGSHRLLRRLSRQAPPSDAAFVACRHAHAYSQVRLLPGASY